MNKFQELGLNESLALKIEKNGITEPTVIQSSFAY
jgi:superfamily II DNA/RNA helicase